MNLQHSCAAGTLDPRFRAATALLQLAVNGIKMGVVRG